MRRIGLAVVLTVSIFLAPVPFFWAGRALDAQPAREQPRFGGVLKVATEAEPPSLDPHWNASAVTALPMSHVFEALFTFDRDFNPIPHLAEGYTLADEGRRYTIMLRKGVRFHNGRDLTAADVVASLNRWGAMAEAGRSLWKLVREVDAKGSHEVVIHLKEPYADLVSSLAGGQGRAAIYPKEVIDAAGTGPLKQFIGTGPFRLVEHRPKVHVRLARFKDYSARNEPPNGAGGKRVAYLDELLFVAVPNFAVRLAGVESGSYHFGVNIKPDQYDRILSMRSVEPRRGSIGFLAAVLNHKQGLMTSLKLRQAFQAALDMEPIMDAAVGHYLFYRLEPGLWPPEQVFLNSKAGAALYNQKDKAKARRLLQEAGYTGQPVRWLTTNELEHHYKSTLVAKQQLEDVGFKIDLQVLDFATLGQIAHSGNKPELYDVFTNMPTGIRAQNPVVQCLSQFSGWWCLEEKERLLVELAREADARKRKGIIDRVQTLFYEDVGQIKFGDRFSMDAVRKELRGDFRSLPFTFFWNAWLEKK
jgi:peptide/nickel transport system substrate-binding protein